MKTRNKKGFTLIDIELAVIAIILIFVVLALSVVNSIKEATNAAKEGAPAAEAVAEMEFPKEKILTISAEAYCASIGKNPADYDMVGVVEDLWSIFIKAIPQGTEVVVSFEMGSNVYAGTALIPKDR